MPLTAIGYHSVPFLLTLHATFFYQRSYSPAPHIRRNSAIAHANYSITTPANFQSKDAICGHITVPLTFEQFRSRSHSCARIILYFAGHYGCQSEQMPQFCEKTTTGSAKQTPMRKITVSPLIPPTLKVEPPRLHCKSKRMQEVRPDC